MSHKVKRSAKQPHKLGADSHDPAIKHEKEVSKGHKHKTSKDIHEDRGIRQAKLGKPKNR